MTTVLLDAEDILGANVSGSIEVRPWAGDKAYTVYDGEQVILGVPAVRRLNRGAAISIEIEPTDGTYCVRWRIMPDSRQGSVTRYTTIPDVESVGFGDLPDVDPATFLPVVDVPSAQEVLAQAEAAADAAASAAAAAEQYAEEAGAAVAGVTPGPDSYIAFGDSLTESSGTNWPSGVGADLGIPAINAGKGGWASTDIALLAGVPVGLTLAGNQVPASGAVNVTALSPTTTYRTDSDSLFFTYPGYLDTPSGPVYGTFSRNNRALTGTFTRTSPGEAVAAPPGTPFYCTQYAANRDWVQTRWLTGRNNEIAGGVIGDTIRDNDLIDRVATGRGEPRGLIFGLTWTTAQGKGTAGRATVDDLNVQAARRYGARFRNPFRWLVDNGLALAGITPTSSDLEAIANDVLPPSLRSDTTHPNGVGYGLIRQYVGNELKGAGYIAGQLPTLPPGQVTGLAVSALAETGFTVSWAAVAGPVAYIVKIKSSTSPGDFQYVGNTTALTLTLSGLVPGTSYSVQVIAVNVAGQGTPSATVTASTTTAPVVLTSDSFTRANAASLGSTDGGAILAWSASQNGVRNNRAARSGGTNGFDALSTVDVAQPNQRVVMDVHVLPTGAQQLGLIARSDSGAATNAYQARVQADGGIYIGRRVAGSLTVLGLSAPGAVLPGSRIELSVQGSTITAIVDGVVRVTRTDSSVTTGGRAGFFLPSSTLPEMDTFTVYDH